MNAIETLRRRGPVKSSALGAWLKKKKQCALFQWFGSAFSVQFTLGPQETRRRLCLSGLPSQPCYTTLGHTGGGLQTCNMPFLAELQLGDTASFPLLPTPGLGLSPSPIRGIAFSLSPFFRFNHCSSLISLIALAVQSRVDTSRS